MRTLKLLIIGMIFLINSSNAQVTVNVTIGSPPPWGPVGYTEIRYYYLPDIEVYYDIQTAMFIYPIGGVWVHREYLPLRYRYYDLYGGYKVVMTNYWGDRPYIYYKTHRANYAKGYRNGSQKTIGVRPGQKMVNYKRVSPSGSKSSITKPTQKKQNHQKQNYQPKASHQQSKPSYQQNKSSGSFGNSQKKSSGGQVKKVESHGGGGHAGGGHIEGGHAGGGHSGGGHAGGGGGHGKKK